MASKVLRYMLCGSLTAMAITSAFAQESPESDWPAAATCQATTVSDDGATAPGEIMASARKTTEVAGTAFSGERLEAKGVGPLIELWKQTPDLVLSQGLGSPSSAVLCGCGIQHAITPEPRIFGIRLRKEFERWD